MTHDALFEHSESGCGSREFFAIGGHAPDRRQYECRRCGWTVVLDSEGKRVVPKKQKPQKRKTAC